MNSKYIFHTFSMDLFEYEIGESLSRELGFWIERRHSIQK